MKESEPIRIESVPLDTAFSNQFAKQQLLGKITQASREYRIGTTWLKRPEGKPNETTYVFSNPEQLEDFCALYDIWIFLSQESVDPPVYPEKILTRVARARLTNSPLAIFTPWGPPYGLRQEITQEELCILKRFREVGNFFKKKQIPFVWLIMGADLYGTEVNPERIPQEVVDSYFANLEEAVSQASTEFTFKKWSQIRQENMQIYSRLSQQYDEEKIMGVLPKGVVDRAQATAQKMSGPETAMAYLRERILEAIIIENLCSPIKVSLAPKDKDTAVDMELPRLYLVPPALRTPWVKEGRTL